MDLTIDFAVDMNSDLDVILTCPNPTGLVRAICSEHVRPVLRRVLHRAMRHLGHRSPKVVECFASGWAGEDIQALIPHIVITTTAIVSIFIRLHKDCLTICSLSPPFQRFSVKSYPALPSIPYPAHASTLDPNNHQ